MTTINLDVICPSAIRTGTGENEGIPHRNWTHIDIPKPAKPKSFPVDEPVRQLEEKKKQVAIEKENVLSTLQCSSFMGNIISEEMLIECAIPPKLVDLANSIYIDDKMPVMIDKVKIPQRPTCAVNFEVFQSKYVPKMNESASLLKEQKFSCVKEAHLVLCQMIRSFIPNLAAHMGKNREGKITRSITFSCSRINHMGKTEGRTCSWIAKLTKNSEGFFVFTHIDSFRVHCIDCIMNRARFTPTEVDFQELFPLRSRFLVAKILKQTPVGETTLTMRKHRRKSFLTDEDRRRLTDIVSKEEVKQEVSNFALEIVGNKEEPNEAYRILQMLTYFQETDHSRAKAFFERDEKERLCLSMMAFIWPEGLDLLKNHSDAIFL